MTLKSATASGHGIAGCFSSKILIPRDICAEGLEFWERGGSEASVRRTATDLISGEDGEEERDWVGGMLVQAASHSP